MEPHVHQGNVPAIQAQTLNKKERKTQMAPNLKTTVITKGNLSSLVSQVLGGAKLQIAASSPSGYERQFQHTDWIDFVDPVQAGGNNGFNERFHALESEFDLISTAITSVDNALAGFEATPPAIGIAVAQSLADGATIPVPSGFQLSETIFFAFAKFFNVDLAQRAGTTVGFSVFANTAGLVTATAVGGATAENVLATGIAIAKKGGW
jgi:hypothetical protein